MVNKTLPILLVDDDEADRLLFMDAIEILELPFIVQTLNDGIQLLDYLGGKDCQLPGLLFLDINMPGKDGLQCVKEIRSDSRYNGISIVIYSTSASEKDIEEAFINGANLYIHKPNDFNVLKQILTKAFLLSRSSQGPARHIENFLLKL